MAAATLFLAVLGRLPGVLLISAVTLLCLWLGKGWFVFCRGMYMVSARGRKQPKIHREREEVQEADKSPRTCRLYL